MKRPRPSAKEPPRDAKSLPGDIIKQIVARVISLLPPALLKEAAAYYQPRLLQPGWTISMGFIQVPVTREALFVFVDLAPRHSWSHAARALLFDPGDGKLIGQYPVESPPEWSDPNMPPMIPLGAGSETADDPIAKSGPTSLTSRGKTSPTQSKR